MVAEIVSRVVPNKLDKSSAPTQQLHHHPTYIHLQLHTYYIVGGMDHSLDCTAEVSKGRGSSMGIGLCCCWLRWLGLGAAQSLAAAAKEG